MNIKETCYVYDCHQVFLMPPCWHVLSEIYWYVDDLVVSVFILLSAAVVSVQTVINTIICCTYMADTSNLSQRGGMNEWV